MPPTPGSLPEGTRAHLPSLRAPCTQFLNVSLFRMQHRPEAETRCFLELRRPWGFSPEARRGSQGASRAAPGKSGLHARGEGVERARCGADT